MKPKVETSDKNVSHTKLGVPQRSGRKKTVSISSNQQSSSPTRKKPTVVIKTQKPPAIKKEPVKQRGIDIFGKQDFIEFTDNYADKISKLTKEQRANYQKIMDQNPDEETHPTE